jgi:serine/threonine protein phosphatase 1
LLKKLLDLIKLDLRAAPVDKAVTIFLGDYVDRGLDSSRVLSILSGGHLPTPAVFLRGNHEAMLLQFLANPEQASHWLSNGGFETLHSYQVDVRQVRMGAGQREAAGVLNANMPAPHRKLLSQTALHAKIGGYYFCHAGVRPKISLERQSEEDLLWIREPFLSFRGDFGCTIVHGHTPVSAPEILPNRINIDTGAYISGRLTSVALEGREQRFLTAS